MSRNGRIDVRVTSAEAPSRSWVVAGPRVKERPADHVQIVVPRILGSKAKQDNQTS